MSYDIEDPVDPREVVVIKEIYDSENAHEAFGEELERALESSCSLIIIEPNRLGDETARWISVGNCLHKTAVISGVGAIVCGLSWGEYPMSYAPLCAVSLFCTGLYTVSWQFDPCVKYQVCSDAAKLTRLQAYGTTTLSTSSPAVVLIRKNDNRRKILHSTVTAMACGFTLYRLYSLMYK